ncbi:MAG: CCA tRNA nucleotidyltransferase [Thermacetogeniaceae bacterium]
MGGAIRALLMGCTPQDWDLATDALPMEVEDIFSREGCKTVATGIKFGTVTVFMGKLPLEITTFRKEANYSDFRHPDQVHFVNDLYTDLARRDFTINALAYDPLLGELHDPFGGVRDLCREEIRGVGEPERRFFEDPLRMMRAIRLAAELGFKIEEKTMHAIFRNAELIQEIAAERVRDELNRILLSTYFMDGMELLKETGLLFLIIPELREGWLFSQYHPSHQYTVLEHTFEALRYTPAKLLVRIAVLLHDVAKPRCFSRGEDGRGHFYGHNHLGAVMAEEILRRLRYEKRLIRMVTTLIREHMLNLKMGPPGIRKLVVRVGQDLIEDLMVVRLADFLAHSTLIIERDLEAFERFREELDAILKEETAFSIRDLAVDGNDVQRILKCRPGPVVGRILRLLWNEVLVEPEKNERSYLLDRIRQLGREDNSG